MVVYLNDVYTCTYCDLRPPKQLKHQYQSVGLEQEVDNIADNPDTEFKFKAIHHEIIDMGQHHRQHRMSAIYNQQTPALHVLNTSHL